METDQAKSLWAICILSAIFSACEPRKTEETSAGRFKYIETLHYGPAGTHGGKGWYVSDRKLTFDGEIWPKGDSIVKSSARCYASPNPKSEVLTCHNFEHNKARVYVFRVKAGLPEVVLASDDRYSNGNNMGEWAGNGRWLLFTNYYFNVETSEKIAVKGLPDDPENHFAATSPDLQTVIYKETGFDFRYDIQVTGEARDEIIKKQYAQFYDHVKRGIQAFWLVDIASGRVKLLELKKDKYPQFSQANWRKGFAEMLVWEKDKTGKDQLIYPK